MIRNLDVNDTQALLDIYNYYVLNSNVTFDIEAVSFETFKSKILLINSEYPFIIFEEGRDLLGFAYGSRFRPKPAYNHTVESTVYVKHDAHGKKIGTQLYATLLKMLKQQGFHTVVGVLTLPNEASVKLHNKFGFKQAGQLNEVGRKFDVWQNIGMWQLTF